MTTRQKRRAKPRHDGKFGARIRYLRLQQGFTQTDVARLAGIDERTYRGWEYDRSVPLPGPALRALATVFRVNPGDLLFGKEYDPDGNS